VTALAAVVRTSREVRETPGRLGKTAAIARCLRHAAPEELEIAIAFLSGETRQGRLGLPYTTLQAAQSAAFPESSRLNLSDVDRAFDAIAGIRGRGAAASRGQRLADLFAQATREERDFLVRLIAGELRQGALEGVMLDAVAHAAGVPAAEVRRAAMVAGGVASVARIALSEGPAGLARFSVQPMRPLLPMLAQPAGDPCAALAALGTALLEWKLDGARVQAHKSGDEVRIFTRSLNEVSGSVPEIVLAVRALPDRSLILDGEAIALRPDGSPHPFQVTMRRFGRKLDVAQTQKELPLSVFFFDCLMRDGEPLIERPTRDRLAALDSALPSALIMPRMVTSDAREAEAFYAGALAQGHEGLMAKALEAPYEAGRRGAGWLKIKREKTLDLVVLAAEWGHGRRRGWLSNLHLGARDPATNGFVMLGKTFKGLTDATLEWQTRQLLGREIGRDERTVHVRPELVVEIAFNDLQESRQYPAALALRFARLKRYRTDKRPDEADTIDTVRRIYSEQGPR
jgi:DNA ligase 1